MTTATIRRIEGKMTAKGHRFALVVSRYNDFITAKLVEGAVDTIVRHDGDAGQVTAIYVPGAFELPLAVLRAAGSGNYDAVVCLGCVIRGHTPHFEYVAGQATRGIAQAAFDTGTPVTFGLLTTDTLEQAIERAGSKAGNKGAEAAACAIEMVNLFAALDKAG